MGMIKLQWDDNLSRVTGCEISFVPPTHDHLLSQVMHEPEILMYPVRIEAAAVGIPGDLASVVGTITIRTTINIQAGGSQTGRVRDNMGLEWLVDPVVGGDII